MAVMCEEENRCLTAAVSGELDHHRAKEVMEAGRDDCGPRPGPGPAGVPGGRAGKAGPI